MSIQDMIKAGQNTIKDTDDVLKRSEKIVEDTIQVATDPTVLPLNPKHALYARTLNPQALKPLTRGNGPGGHGHGGDSGRADEADGARAGQPG